MVYQTINDVPEKEVQELSIIGTQKIDHVEFTGIEGGFGEGKRAMLVKEIADIHGQEFKEVNRRINDNRNRFKNGVDIIDIRPGGFEPLGRQLGFSKQSFNQSNNIYLLSERGYAKLLKILEDDLAWELYDKLVDGYFNMRKQQPKTHAEMFFAASQAMMEQQKDIKVLQEKVAATDSKVESIKEVVGVNFTNWRESTIKILKKIGTKLGGCSMYSEVTRESYELLNKRAKADLERRLTNMRRKMADEGMSLSKRNKMNYLDVIGQDPRLIEIYVAVVKEMAIKYGIDLPETA